MISFIKDMVYHSVHFNSTVHNVQLSSKAEILSDFHPLK